MVFLKEFFEKFDFEKNQQMTKKHKNLPRRQRVDKFNTFLLTKFEPWHEISNNVVCATSKSSDQPVL